MVAAVVLFPNWSPERRSGHVVGPKSQAPVGSQGMIRETAPKPSQFPRQIHEAHTPIFDFLIPNLPSFMYAPFWFALGLGLEGPPGLLADGHLLPNA